MTTAYTTNLGLALPVTGELDGTWGDTVNNYITQYTDAAVAGTQTISGTQTAVTLSITNGTSLSQAGGAGTTGSAQYQVINCTGNPAGLLTITAPASSKSYIIINATSTSQSVKIVGAGPTTGVTVVSGEKAIVAWNGSDFVKVASSVADGVTSVSGTGTVNGITLTGTVTSTGSLTLGGTLSGVSLTSQVTGTLPVANGGTGATTLTGLVKGNGTSAFTAAVSGTDYAPATSGTSILYGNGSGGFSNVTIGSGISFAGGTLSSTGSGGTVTSVTASSPLASSGGSTPNISFTGTLATANGGTGNANGTVAKLATTNFSVEESGGNLVFKYGATVIASMDSSGNIISAANITAYGTP